MPINSAGRRPATNATSAITARLSIGVMYSTIGVASSGRETHRQTYSPRAKRTRMAIRFMVSGAAVGGARVYYWSPRCRSCDELLVHDQRIDIAELAVAERARKR